MRIPDECKQPIRIAAYLGRMTAAPSRMQLLLARPFISCAYPRTIEPARALAAETLKLERELKAEGYRLNAEGLPLLGPDPGGD